MMGSAVLRVIYFLAVAGWIALRGDAVALPGTSIYPTHIVKLKTSDHHGSTKASAPKPFAYRPSDSHTQSQAIEPRSYIRRHYNLFQTTARSHYGSMRAAGVTEEPRFDTVGIGGAFEAVIGTFHPAFADYLDTLDDVDYVEPNRVYSIDAVASAPSAPSPPAALTQLGVPSWGIARVGHRTNEDLTTFTSEHGSGQNIHVYVFDTGINVQHPDFEGRAVHEISLIDSEDEQDYAGHGTHVAGTIGGRVFGIAKNAQLHAVKILDRHGDGTTAALLKAISHVIKVAQPGKSIINLSLSGPRSQTIDDALTALAVEHNIPVIASAGNSGDDACNYSPSANPNVFAVGASNKDDVVTVFSSYGPCVQLYAPGTNITSAWLGTDSMAMDGTSMANPHVTGIAAQLMSHSPFGSAQQLYEALKKVAIKDVLAFPVRDTGSINLLANTGLEQTIPEP